MGFEAGAGSLHEPLDAVLERKIDGWRHWVDAWRDSAQGRSLIQFVDRRVAEGATVYPADVLRALALTPLEAVKVVILGQDPYHGPGQAHGLAFSVPDGIPSPPSLRNVLAELKRDLEVSRSTTDLSSWARQGVLLLNTSLTVEAGRPASHSRHGWESLTQALVSAVAARPEPCVYLLWGAHAQQFEPLILASASTRDKPLILKANHPSPLSARRPPVPFIGCGHFSEAERYLKSQGRAAIDWSA